MQPHCHWSYEADGYRTFNCWPTEQLATEALAALRPNAVDAHVYPIHAPGCACEREETAA